MQLWAWRAQKCVLEKFLVLLTMERRTCMLLVFDVLDQVLSDHALIWKASGYPVTSRPENIMLKTSPNYSIL